MALTNHHIDGLIEAEMEIGAKRMKYIIPEYTTAEHIRELRKRLNMTQKEFAEFVGCSKPTVERWESSDKKITGPIVTLMEILKRDNVWAKKLRVPEKKFRLRIYYMYRDEICTIIDADESRRLVEIKNYTDNLQYRAFGINTEPSFEDYEEFLESRCFPRTRDKMKLELDKLGIPFYDPMMIIEKTEGRMADDDFWLKIEV